MGESDDVTSNMNSTNLLHSLALQKLKNRFFMSLGYGVNAYFDTLVQFIKLFGIMTLINIFIIGIYFYYDGMRSLSGASLTSKLSIGNLGFS